MARNPFTPVKSTLGDQRGPVTAEFPSDRQHVQDSPSRRGLVFTSALFPSDLGLRCRASFGLAPFSCRDLPRSSGAQLRVLRFILSSAMRNALPMQQARARSLPAKVIRAVNEGVCWGNGGRRIRQAQSEAMRSSRNESPTIAEPHCAPASDSATLRRRTSSLALTFSLDSVT
jgi:hypothetical protein